MASQASQFRLGLAPRATIAGALLVIAILALFGWTLHDRARRNLLDDQRQILMARTEWVGGLLRAEVASLRRAAERAASLPSLRSALAGNDETESFAQAGVALTALLAANPRLLAVRVRDGPGNELLRAQRIGDSVRFGVSNARPASSTGRVSISGTGSSQVVVSVVTLDTDATTSSGRRRVVRASTAVRSADRLRVGDVILEVDLGRWLDELLGSTPAGIEAWIADEDDTHWVGGAAIGGRPLDWLARGPIAEFSGTTPTQWSEAVRDGARVYVAHTVVPLTDSATRPFFLVAHGVSESALQPSLARIRLGIITGSLAWSVLLIGALWLVLRWALRPMRRMVAVAERVGAGDYDAALGTTDNGELGVLSKTLRQMIDRIRAREVEIRHGAEALRASEARFRSTLNDMQEGFQIIGHDWRYLYVNESAARHGRVSAESLIGRTMMEAYPGIESTELFRVLQRCLAERTRARLENEFVYPDGTSAWFDLAIHPSTEGLFVTSYDITDRRRSETALARSAETARRDRDRLEALIKVVPDAVVHVDSKGRVADVNVQGEVLFGYKREELISQPFQVLLPTRLHEQAASIRSRVLADPGVRPIPMEEGLIGRRKDGTEFRLAGSIGPLATEDGLDLVATVRDVTDLWHASRHVLSQIEHLTMLDRLTRSIAARHDVDSLLRVVAAGIESDLHVDVALVCDYDHAHQQLVVRCAGPSGEALGDRVRLRPGDTIPIVENGLTAMATSPLIQERVARDHPFPLPRRLAAAGFGAFVIAPLRSENQLFGALLAIRGVDAGFTSIECEFLRQLAEHVALGVSQAQLQTALQDAYDDLRQSQQSVTQLERLRAMSEMASGVAHDINNTLAPVLLYAQVILSQEENLSEQTREYLQCMQDSVRAISETVTRIREFSRPPDLDRTVDVVDLNGLVEQAVAFTHARWADIAMREGRTIEVTLTLASDLPAFLGVDSEIRDAVTNVILNAVDAMPQGGTLTIRTRHEWVDADQGSMVVMEVSDTGTGMDPETRRRCMEPFYTTKGSNGTGLGLAMVFGTMQRHGGSVTIESAPGVGTTVQLRFPENANGTAKFRGDAGPPIQTRPLQVLVIDDDPVVLRSMKDVLTISGHATQAVGGGEAGLQAFRDAARRGQPYDVVITDLGMPRVDGRQVAASVKAASPATPVILLTGWGRRMLAESDIPPHVDRVLGKPTTLEDLRRALADVVQPLRGDPS